MSGVTRIMTAVQLTRLTIAFGAVSDIWFVILLLRAGIGGDVVGPPGAMIAEMSLPAALTAGAIIAVGLFAYGASLNDVLDVRHDATFSPDRPIPAGRIGHAEAMIVTVAALIVAILGAVWIGTWSVCITLLTAVGLLFYNAAAKYIPSAGVITLGLVHAAHMFIPAEQLAFTFPVWLVMTHAIGVAVAVHVLEQKRPRFNRRETTLAIVGWLFWSVMLILVARRGGGGWPEEIPVWRAGIPLLVGLSFVAVVRWKVRQVDARSGAEKVRRYGAMWQSLYGAAWLYVLGLTTEAIWIGLFALGGFATMTLIKEITGHSGRPVSYR